MYSGRKACSNVGVNPDDVIAELRSLLAASEARSASFQRMMERQGYQLDRMQDQLERALREIEALRKQLGKPPPDPPKPTPPSAPAAGAGPDAASEPPSTPSRDKPPKKKKGKFGRNAIPAALERVVETPPLGPCTECGAEDWVSLREETSEMYDFIPARLVAKVVIRGVCRCAKCQHIAIAPFPDDLIARMRATPGLIGYIIYEKYGRHLPLYRVDKELSRLGGEIPEQTRDQWLNWAAARLKRLEPLLKALMFAAGLVHTDGTGLAVVRPKLKTHLGQMAVFGNHVATMFDFTPTKHGIHQRRFLGIEAADADGATTDVTQTDCESVDNADKGNAKREELPRFVGYLVADAASIADRTFDDPNIVECGCNAHARRNFEDCEAVDRKVAGEAIAFWTALYAIESAAKTKGLSAEDRLALRRARSAPIVEDFRRWIETHVGTRVPSDPVSKALNYAINHWAALTRFLQDGRIPLDNNLAERALKAIAMGRKAYMFAGSIAAAKRSATFYTFVATCELHGVDPQEWLADVLPRIDTTRKSQLVDLLPMNWAATRQVRMAA